MESSAGQIGIALTQPTAARRETLFRESLPAIAERLLLGTAWALKPHRIGGLLPLTAMLVENWMAPNRALPDPESALDNPPGLCGIVRDLSPATLSEAYRRGLFPFSHIAPLKWWSLPERSVLFFDELHIGKNLRRLMRKGQYTVTFDRDFEGVVTACAGRREGKWHLTWITPKIMHAFADMFDAGYVHSFEVWNERKELVGGGYGVAVGDVFFTESQFSHERDTSKLGFTVLNWHLGRWGFRLNDGKGMTPTCRDMGFRLIPRSEFLRHLEETARRPDRKHRWQVETEPSEIAAEPKRSATEAAKLAANG